MPDGPLPVRRLATAVLVGVVVLAGCTVEPGSFPGQQEPLGLPDAPAPTPGFGLLQDRGVTDEPCPDAVNADNGCIHLGALVDTEGPFGALGAAALDGARAYWQHVNEQGGVVHRRADGLEGRFDVALEDHVEETGDDVASHLEALEALAPDVAALALSQGTTATVEALPLLARADMVTVPLSWWSGWAFETLVPSTGATVCLQAINGMDWAQARLGDDTPVGHVVVVHTPDLHGQDVLRGVAHWTDPHVDGDHVRVPFEPDVHAVAVEPDADVDTAVERIDTIRPDVVVLATAPAQTGAIARAAVDLGWDGLLVGVGSTWSTALLDEPAVAEALTGRTLVVAPVGPLTQETPAHAAMRETLGLGAVVDPADDRVPDQPAWVAGWVAQYPLHAALHHAVLAGDLTPAGIVHAIDTVVVEHEGALPLVRPGGPPEARTVRDVFVSEVDVDALHGLRLVGDGFVGATAAAYPLTRPCTEGTT